MDISNLKDKSVLITGGSIGIGLGIAKHLMQQGCQVAITGRTASKVDEAVASLKSVGSGKVIGIAGDVRKMADMQKAVSETEKAFGKLDVVVANAGVGHFGSIEDISGEQWNQTVDTNLTGVFNTVKASIAALKKSKGYIITIASLAGTNFFQNGSAYNASKFGVVGFTQAIMLDLRQYDIKVSTIMPGSVTSHFNGHVPNEKDAWKIQPEDLGQMVADLLRMNPRTLPSKIEVRPSKPPTA